MHRYRLATYRECKAHREWNTTCPDCGRKGKFSPYIDTVTMQPVDDKRCGRCNRLSNCGYHLPPREVARTEDFVSRKSRERREKSDYMNCISHANLANHAKFASLHSRIVPRQHSAQPTSCEPSAMQPSRDLRDSREEPNNQREAEEFYNKMHRSMNQSLPWGHHLATWLRTKFLREQVDAALERYHVGGTPDGATLWWQIDEQGRVHTGKAMQYNPLTGHRVKEQGFPVNWAHRMRLYGEPTDLIVPQCLFGEHLAPLLSPQGGKTAMPEYSPLGEIEGAALVESEKTALILSLLCPDKLWLATGGKQGFKESMLQPLIGYDVEVYPDADALTDWYARAVEMNRTLGTRLHIPTWYYDLMNHDEARRAGLDLADVVMGEGMS
ncbi:MAG: hypothetical protein IKV15_09290 [Bacteroidaceae bacterium]|nr:hypothetical protein [Bacteroidaceae bacterium]